MLSSEGYFPKLSMLSGEISHSPGTDSYHLLIGQIVTQFHEHARPGNSRS
jgi:hypothetical protein